MNRLPAILCLFFLTVLAAPALAADVKPSGTVKSFDVAPTPKAAPAFSWSDGAGVERSLDDYRGKVVVMNFWATWCAPCITELPSLYRLQESLGSAPVVLIALNIDRGEAGAAKARAMLHRLKLDALAFHHDQSSRAYRALGIQVMPTTIIFDPQGREVGRLPGPAEWDAPEARALIEAFKR